MNLVDATVGSMAPPVFDEVTLSIADALVLNDGKWRMSEEALEKHGNRLAALEGTRKKRVGNELVIFLDRLLGECAEDPTEAATQLTLLTAIARGTLSLEPSVLPDEGNSTQTQAPVSLDGAGRTELPRSASEDELFSPRSRRKADE
jgi:hypothetical protein